MTKPKRDKPDPENSELPLKLDHTLLGSGIRMPKKKSEYDDFTSFFRAYLRHLRRYIVTGLLVWVPLLVTLWVTWWFVTTVGFGLNDFMQDRVANLHALGARVPFLSFLNEFHYQPWIGFLLAILIFLTTGFLARYFVGRQLIGILDAVISNIPFISKIYLAVQQIRDVFVGREGAVFEEVVILEYPRKGVYAVAFVTSREQGIIQEAADEALVAIFVPTTPNPTSGFLLYVPDADLHRVDVSIEDGMKLIVSGGAYIPGKPNPILGDADES